MLLSLQFDPQKRLARLAGAMTVDTPRSIWRPLEADRGLGSAAGINEELTLDLAGLTALDLNGSAQFLSIVNQLDRSGVQVSVKGLPDDLAAIFHLAQEALKAPAASPPARIGLIEETGRKLVAIKNDAATLVTFTGELLIDFLDSLRNPSLVRWTTVEYVAERSGVNAVPIVALVSLLVGLIIAFQSAMVLKYVGLEIFVADMVGVAIVRELGPLITAIVLAGRSGSAFSAELGAMKAAEEVDAITTMGLSPVRELALPRVLASLLTTPVVTLIACFTGIWGGCLVLMAMGYSLLTIWQEAIDMVSATTFYICIFKSIIFGFVVAAIGCQRGLAAGDGPGAVGEATTSGVVTNIVVVAVIDSLLAVLFYIWDI